MADKETASEKETLIQAWRHVLALLSVDNNGDRAEVLKLAADDGLLTPVMRATSEALRLAQDPPLAVRGIERVLGEHLEARGGLSPRPRAAGGESGYDSSSFSL